MTIPLSTLPRPSLHRGSGLPAKVPQPGKRLNFAARSSADGVVNSRDRGHRRVSDDQGAWGVVSQPGVWDCPTVWPDPASLTPFL